MRLEISDSYTLLTEPHTEYLNIYTMKDTAGRIRLTLTTSEPIIENAQSICLVLSNKQAEMINALISKALEGEPNIVQSTDEVE